jgi:hypothetical protein
MNTTTKLYGLTLGLFLTCFTMVNANIFSTNTDSRYQYELNQLNVFLEDFDDGYFSKIEVIDDYINISFKKGNYSKFRLEDMASPILDSRWGYIYWDCKNESLCVETDWNENGKESGILFVDSGSSNLDYLIELLNNFINAYNK